LIDLTFLNCREGVCHWLVLEGELTMILGMSLSAFTTLHVIIGLIAIVSGIIVMFGLLGSNRMPGLTAIFLLFTILTSATGFLFPSRSCCRRT